jgi:hypothetical protein
MTTNTEFYKVIREFVPDLLGTFPEYKETITTHYVDILEENYETEQAKHVYDTAKSMLPKHFFDIMYKNNEIFEQECEIIPEIDFSKLMNDDITEKTRETLWKYLQLMLFSIVGDVKGEDEFGDTAKLFEAINEDEFKNALENTISEMKDFFEDGSGNTDEVDGSGNEGLPDAMPNPEDIHNHIQGMLNGKIGKLAQEIANETASELNLEDGLEEGADMDTVFKKLFRNPAKLMSIIKKVGGKIEEKMKSGDLNERELMEEAATMMDKMKSMPGMKNMKQMFSKMGLPKEMLGSLGANMGKMNIGAMQGALQQNIKQSKQRERMLKKLEERKAQREGLQNVQASTLSSAEPLEQSTRSSKPSHKSKNKKHKGGKNKKKK